MRTLITGTAGFIGFHLARRLLSEGHEVLGYDGMTDYYDVALKRDRHHLLKQHQSFVGVESMLEDKRALDQALDSFEPDFIIHLAAQAGVRYSLENPQSYVDANLVGTFNVLEAARRTKPNHLLLASSSSVYGANATMPFAERDKADLPMSLYAATKKAGEAMAHSYAHLFDIPTTSFRFFTVYGPWGRPDMALFKFVKAIASKKPIDVYGQGQMRRDFTYVDDLIDGVVGLMQAIPQAGMSVSKRDSVSPVAPFRIVNVGAGNPVGLMQFIEAIELATGTIANKNFLPRQAGDAVETYADPTLLRELTGHQPKIDVREGVRKFVDWYSEYYSSVRDTKGVLHGRTEF